MENTKQQGGNNISTIIKHLLEQMPGTDSWCRVKKYWTLLSGFLQFSQCLCTQRHSLRMCLHFWTAPCVLWVSFWDFQLWKLTPTQAKCHKANFTKL